MNRVRVVNTKTNVVTYCERNALRDLERIGFVEQPEPIDEQIDLTATPKKTTTKKKSDATN